MHAAAVVVVVPALTPPPQGPPADQKHHCCIHPKHVRVCCLGGCNNCRLAPRFALARVCRPGRGQDITCEPASSLTPQHILECSLQIMALTRSSSSGDSSTPTSVSAFSHDASVWSSTIWTCNKMSSSFAPDILADRACWFGHKFSTSKRSRFFQPFRPVSGTMIGGLPLPGLACARGGGAGGQGQARAEASRS